MTQTAFEMPLRNERKAPTFDSSKPRELPRFFKDLEELFKRAGLQKPMPTQADEQVMKNHAVDYVDVTTEQTWKAIPEYDATSKKSFQAFKDAILSHYPVAAGGYIYSNRDMDMLIGERQRLGITTNKDLADYHLQFMAITNWLIAKKLLGEFKQQRAYIRAFSPELLHAIMNRLQITHSTHPQNQPFEVQEVYEAARYI